MHAPFPLEVTADECSSGFERVAAESSAERAACAARPFGYVLTDFVNIHTHLLADPVNISNVLTGLVIFGLRAASQEVEAIALCGERGGGGGSGRKVWVDRESRHALFCCEGVLRVCFAGVTMRGEG